MNSLDKIIEEGEVVVLKEKYYKGDENVRKFKCESGDGMNPDALDATIFGTFVDSGKKDKIEGYEIEKEEEKLPKIYFMTFKKEEYIKFVEWELALWGITFPRIEVENNIMTTKEECIADLIKEKFSNRPDLCTIKEEIRKEE